MEIFVNVPLIYRRSHYRYNFTRKKKQMLCSWNCNNLLFLKFFRYHKVKIGYSSKNFYMFAVLEQTNNYRITIFSKMIDLWIFSKSKFKYFWGNTCSLNRTLHSSHPPPHASVWRTFIYYQLKIPATTTTTKTKRHNFYPFKAATNAPTTKH